MFLDSHRSSFNHACRFRILFNRISPFFFLHLPLYDRRNPRFSGNDYFNRANHWPCKALSCRYSFRIKRKNLMLFDKPIPTISDQRLSMQIYYIFSQKKHFHVRIISFQTALLKNTKSFFIVVINSLSISRNRGCGKINYIVEKNGRQVVFPANSFSVIRYCSRKHYCHR